MYNPQRNESDYLPSMREAPIDVVLIHPVLQISDPKRTNLVGACGLRRLVLRHLLLGMGMGLRLLGWVLRRWRHLMRGRRLLGPHLGWWLLHHHPRLLLLVHCRRWHLRWNDAVGWLHHVYKRRKKSSERRP